MRIESPYLIPIMLTLVAMAGCDDSSDSPRLKDCPKNYVVGRWVFQGNEVGITLDYGEDGEYGRVESAGGPPFVTVGTYELGKHLTNENGLDVCEIWRTIGDAQACLNHIYIEEDVLYESSCDLVIDFGTPFYRWD